MAVAVALPVRVNVHVLVLPPLLEQAPDQMALRPLVALRVILVPAGNCADALLPTATLMPVGAEVTRVPLRPVAFTVSVAGCPAAAVVMPRPVDKMVSPFWAVSRTVVSATRNVVTVKVALVAPAGTVTLGGTLAALGS